MRLYIQGAAVVWIFGASVYMSVFVYRRGLADMRQRHERENRELAERRRRLFGS